MLNQLIDSLNGFAIGLTAVILVLFAAALASIIGALRAFAREERGMVRVRQAARALDEEAEQRQEARQGLAEAFAAGKPGADTAVGERVRAMARGALHGELPDREGLMSAAELRLHRPLQFARTIASVLVLVGLAGTLAGLTQAVAGLSRYQSTAADTTAAVVPAGSAQDVNASIDALQVQQQRERIDRLFESVEDTLAGMQTAFVPALVAVVLTVLLLLALFFAQRKELAVIRDLEECTDAVLVPLFHVTGARGAQEVQAMALRVSEALLKASRRSSDALGQAVTQASAELVKAVSDAAGQLRDATTQAYRDLGTFVSRASDEIATAGKAVATAAEGAAARMDDVVSSGSGVVEKVMAHHRETVAASIEELDAATARLALVLSMTETAAGGVSEAVKAGGAVAERLARADERLGEALECIGEQLDQSSRGAQQVALSNTHLAAALQDLERMRTTLSGLLATQQEWARDTSSHVREQSELAREVLGRVEEMVRKATENGGAPHPVVTVQTADTGEQLQRLADYLAHSLAEQRREDEARWRRMLDEAVSLRLGSGLGSPDRMRVPVFLEHAKVSRPDVASGGITAPGPPPPVTPDPRPAIDPASLAESTTAEPPLRPVGVLRRVWRFLNKPLW